MARGQLDETLARLSASGVIIVDPRQTYVAPDVDPTRVCAGAILHAGTRLSGPRTLLAPGAEVGVQGPATLVDAALGPGARVDSGYVEGTVLFAKARVGFGGHVRAGSILEEEASIAHAVGLKHSILMAFATIGSNVNFCDVLLSGGTARDDHSEIGSGFIHFNYTPWGRRGDKATASCVGDVVHGVFLRERRIFLGGSGGMIGPRRVGFGAVTGAGQVVRRDVPADRIVLSGAREIDRPHAAADLDPLAPRAAANLHYIAQLCALRAWYRAVRLARAQGIERAIVEVALDTVQLGIAERRMRLEAFVRERGGTPPVWTDVADPPCPLPIDRDPDRDHIAWVRALTDEEVTTGQSWLQTIADAAMPPMP